jgi:hypothetical protein
VFAPFRDALAELVGLRGKHGRHPLLWSVGAYEVAYWRLHDAVAGLLPRAADVQAPERETAEVYSEGSRELVEAWGGAHL